MQLVPYVNFPGNAREAMTHYQSIFGGELTVATFGEYGVEGMPEDGVMHAGLTSDAFTLYASDAQPGDEAAWGQTRISLMVEGDDADQLGSWYQEMAADGEIVTPFEQQLWGDKYGLVRDRYGIEWMFDAGPVDDAAPTEDAGP